MNYSKLKKDAIKRIEKNQKVLVTSVFVLVLISIICNFVGKVIGSLWLSDILMLIANSLLIMGFIRMLVKTSNRKKVKLEELTSETSLCFKYIGITVVKSIIIGILLLISAIAFKSLVTVMVHFNEINVVIGTVLVAFGIILTVAVLMTAAYMAIAFSQSLFILNDERDLPVLKILSKSFNMMEGYIIDYFILLLNFIGWVLLGICTLGIAFLWVIPYLGVTQANFYKTVKKEYEKIKGNNEPEEIFNDNDAKEAE